jgi:hypothetical protein
MRSFVAVVASILWLAACTTTHGPTPQETDAAKNAYTKCLIDNIARVDDGHSDPQTIAARIQPACAVQYDAVIQIAVYQCCTTENSKITTQQNMKSEELKLITGAVLHYRAAKQGK